MKQFTLPALFILAVVAPALPARADGLFYLTGKLGSTDVDAELHNAFNQILDGDDDSRGFGLGLRFGKRLAFELAYHDFGTVAGYGAACADPEELCIALVVPIEADTTAVSLTALPHLPVSDRFFVYGKLGVMSWETSLSNVAPELRRTIEAVEDEDIVYGIGVRYLLPGPIGVFAELERFGDDFETVSLGATLGF